MTTDPIGMPVLVINTDMESLLSMGETIQLPPDSYLLLHLGDPVFIAGGKYRHGRIEYWINTGKFCLSDVGKLNDTVFLTREAAEKRIEEWKAKHFDPTYDR